MRGRILVCIGAAAACLAAAPPAHAGGLGLFGFLPSSLRAFIGVPRGMHRGRRAHHARPRSNARAAQHPPAATQSAAQAAAPAAGAPADAVAANAATAAAPPLWPNFHARVYADIIGYALWPQDGADRLWSHGAADLVDAIIAPAPVVPDARVASPRGHPRLAKARETTGSAAPSAAAESTSADDGGICGARARDLALTSLDSLTQPLQLTDAQQAALAKLCAALSEEIESRRADCAPKPPATAVERLKTMKAGLRSVRNVGIYIRTPLKNFYDSLTGDQKTRFRADALPSEHPASERGRAHSAAAAPCGRAGPPAWPAEAIAQSIEPTDEQRASLERLRMTYGGLAKALMTSCPSTLPMTPLERLDAADDRLLSLASAAATMNGALMDFYGRLSDDQKQRFNLLRR